MTVPALFELQEKGIPSNSEIETILDNANGSKIEAIRKIREDYGFSLAPSKMLIDNVVAKRAFKARLDMAINEYIEETEHQMPANYWLQFKSIEDVLIDFNIFFDVWALTTSSPLTPEDEEGTQRRYSRPTNVEPRCGNLIHDLYCDMDLLHEGLHSPCIKIRCIQARAAEGAHR